MKLFFQYLILPVCLYQHQELSANTGVAWSQQEPCTKPVFPQEFPFHRLQDLPGQEFSPHQWLQLPVHRFLAWRKNNILFRNRSWLWQTINSSKTLGVSHSWNIANKRKETYQFLKTSYTWHLSWMVMNIPRGLLYIKPYIWHANPTVGV